MGLVQNLKKILTESGKIILQGLLSHYIKQRAKQTLKKQDNSSETTSSQNPLTTEPPHTTIATSSVDTTEKITTVEPTTEEIVKHVHDWAIDRVTNLVQPPDEVYVTVFEPDRESIKDAMALAAEFNEWFDDSDSSQDIEIISIERIE